MTKAIKDQVMAAYSFAPSDCPDGKVEIVHLWPRELGGADETNNLWPQCYLTQPWNAHVKDRLENRLHALVCGHQMALDDAVACIVHSWVACYERVIGAEGAPPVR